MAPKDVTRLWEVLRHRDPEEKLDWIRQLAKDPTPDAVEVLLDALEQESWFLRDQAATALASMGESVIEPLVQRLDSGLWFTRAAAAAARGTRRRPTPSPKRSRHSPSARSASRSTRSTHVTPRRGIASRDWSPIRRSAP
jgi:hypothetical protein